MPLAPADVVQETETGFTGKTSADGNACKEGAQRRLPFAGHDQDLTIVLPAQACGQILLDRPAEALARLVADEDLADAGHVVGDRGAQRAGDHVDRPVRGLRAQQPHHRMAADEIADPDERNDQNRAMI